ncbi:MAG TPA: CinA family nicotinamide mononucleotide deamidase-related protein [Chitinophaga sp.]
MEKILASIITIGDELLIGQTIDTNSAWIAQQLNAAGIWVHRRVAVGDTREAILRALDEEGAASSLILITGGLGPTADDITKPVLCDYFGGVLVQDEAALQNVLRILDGRGLPTLQRNLDQALVPDVCTVIPNKRGTAPGMWFEQHGKIYISMPGVPYEMQGMMLDYILPRLPELYNTPAVLHQTLLTSGMGESFVAERIADFENALPPQIKLAYLPGYGLLKLRLTAFGKDKLTTAVALMQQFTQLKSLLADITVAEEDIPIGEVLGRLLVSRGQTVGTAESCTGGYIAHLLTLIPGSSAYYRGSVVSYANQLKQRLLQVPAAILDSEGAVSEAAVLAMVKGALEQLQTDYAIAVSGIMGPDGGSPEKPVGTVWVAVGDTQRQTAVKYQLRYDRLHNVEMTAAYAINELRKFILANGH